MSATASKLDTVKFGKVHRLMTRGATVGERDAAKARAESMAAKAGLSLKEAVSEMDRKAAPAKPRSFFDDLMDDPAFRASHEASMAKRESADAAMREKALAECGSEDAVWAETERERVLRETLEPLADWGRYAFAGADPGGLYIKGYAGWDHGQPTLALLEALVRAYPFAPDLAGQWSEYQEWERLYTYRHAFETHYDFPVHVRARMAALRFHLDTLSDPTFEGFAARLEWLKFRTERDMSSDVHDDLSMIATMRVDLAMLKATHAPRGEGVSPQARPLPRTTAEKRAAILSMLDSEPGLSNREIARRLSVSPQTVSTWRKAK